MAVPDRGSAPVGFLSRGDTGRILAGQLFSFWGSITRGGSIARERRLNPRRSWPGFLTGWGVMPRAGGPGWTNCAVVDCSAVSSPPVESGCAKLPNGWTCDAWQTWLAVRRDDANLNFGRHRQRMTPIWSASSTRGIDYPRPCASASWRWSRPPLNTDRFSEFRLD